MRLVQNDKAVVGRQASVYAGRLFAVAVSPNRAPIRPDPAVEQMIVGWLLDAAPSPWKPCRRRNRATARGRVRP